MTIFKKLKSTLQLVQNFDMDKIAKLSKKVDLNKMIGLGKQHEG